jgi:hypothetical protein
MVINRIHLGPVVFARTLAASIAARQAAPLTQPATDRGRRRQRDQKLAVVVADASRAGGVLRPHPIDRGNHVIEGFHQWCRNPVLRRFL